MENSELIKRAEDLAERCERTGSLTRTNFLTPAERYELEKWAKHSGASIVFSGGIEGTERSIAFFLPDWMERDTPDVS